jgi:hypothetical protein
MRMWRPSRASPMKSGNQRDLIFSAEHIGHQGGSASYRSELCLTEVFCRAKHFMLYDFDTLLSKGTAKRANR